MELMQRAIAIGAPLDTTALPIERQVRHAIGTARALARWNRIDEALAALLDAEIIGPTRCATTSSPATSSGTSSPVPGHPDRLSNSANAWASGPEDLAGSWAQISRLV